MQPFPHRYVASASGGASGEISVDSPGLSMLTTAAPAEFGGPGDLWSPETLLCAAVADCFVLTFRAIARASRFEWTALSCRVEGVLDRVDGGSRFVRFVTYATLQVDSGADATRAEALLAKAEHGCLVANSLTAARELVVVITQPASA